MVNKPTVISLFCGCGGSSLGYELAGYNELLAVDFDEDAIKAFKLNFDVPVWNRDIKTITGEEILSFCNLKKGELDVLDGSPPCQGFSTQGKRVVGDSRNDLVREYLRIVQELEPKCFIMENVSGMIKGTMKGLFKEFIQEMNSFGYTTKVQLLNSKWLDVPQSRERLIFVGVRNDIGLQPVFPKPLKRIISVKDAIDDLGNVMRPEINHIWTDEKAKNTLNYRRALTVKQGELYKPLRKRYEENKPLPTITGAGTMKLGIPLMLGSSGCHYKYTRTLSIRELARCQSFPDSFKFYNDLVSAPGRIGNSVPPMMMMHVAKTVKENILQKCK